MKQKEKRFEEIPIEEVESVMQGDYLDWLRRKKANLNDGTFEKPNRLTAYFPNVRPKID